VRTSITGFLGDLITNFIGADSRLLRTLLHVAFKPGRLTAEWIAGHRIRYTHPVQLYLLAAGAFFLLNAYHPFVRLHPTDLTVESSLTAVVVSNELTAEQQATLANQGVSIEVFREQFEARVSAILAPFLIVVVILFSLLTAAVMARRGHPYAHHAVFALHWCTFYLLIEAIHRIVGGGAIGEIITGLVAMVYLIVAIAKVYGGRLGAIGKGLVLELGFLIFLGLWLHTVMAVALP
jgi:hypothetical protein